ncbi:MAG: flippase-like domain-containing protein [Bacteroidetes bacterium]|nr:flippase-like domain-containing protein [Bacteroidota bacterium]MCH8231541.1 flippase-like domain-containing protein [Bacteroidota bacterium]
MQFNYTTSILKERKFIIAWNALKAVILISCLAVILLRVRQDHVKLYDLVANISKLPLYGWAGIVLISMLAPINWLLEALKWKFLTRHIEKLSIRDAFRSVVIGLSFGFATPRALGDYIGRTLVFRHDNKLKIILPVFVSRMAQLIPTLMFGMVGMSFLINVNTDADVLQWRVSGLFAALILIFAGIAFLTKNNRIVRKFKRFENFAGRLLLQISRYSPADLIRVSGYSVLRYIVFSGQFMIALWIFGLHAELLLLFAGVTWILLAKSIMPSFNFLSDLGIREVSAIVFFGAYNYPVLPVLSASLLIWVINILLPALSGVVLAGKTKI